VCIVFAFNVGAAAAPVNRVQPLVNSNEHPVSGACKLLQHRQNSALNRKLHTNAYKILWACTGCFGAVWNVYDLKNSKAFDLW
jgi:hypothetical protein